MLNCNECLYNDTDCIMCEKARLAEAWNEFLKEVPVLRFLAMDFECPYFENKEDETE